MNRNRRSGAEWVTFGISCGVLAVVVSLVVVQLVQPSTPAAPVAAVAGVAHDDGGPYYVDVSVTNEGRATAANVQVAAGLTIDDRTTEADQVIDFLAGSEQQDLVFVFADDPGSGELEVAVVGFAVP